MDEFNDKLLAQLQTEQQKVAIPPFTREEPSYQEQSDYEVAISVIRSFIEESMKNGLTKQQAIDKWLENTNRILYEQIKED